METPNMALQSKFKEMGLDKAVSDQASVDAHQQSAVDTDISPTPKDFERAEEASKILQVSDAASIQTDGH
jgi:hypothetical protein